MDRKNIVLTDNKLINIHVSSQNMTYFIRIKTNEVNIDYAIDGGQVKVLILNDFMGDVLINDSGYVKNHGKLEITYIDLNKFNYNQVSHVDVYQDSILNITSKYLAINNKVIKMDYINREKYSEINIDFFDNSQYLQNQNPNEWTYELQKATYLYFFTKLITTSTIEDASSISRYSKGP